IVAKDNPPRIRLYLATDDVEQGGFPGAVRTNEGAQLTAIDVKVDAAQDLEAVKTDGNIFEIDDAACLLHYASKTENLPEVWRPLSLTLALSRERGPEQDVRRTGYVPVVRAAGAGWEYPRAHLGRGSRPRRTAHPG